MKLKKGIALIMLIIGMVALVLKLKLRIELEDESITESVTRFLSYFTILTNLLTTIYFAFIFFSKNEKTIFHKPGTLTAIAAFMAFVGIAYHILLRHVWDPQGLTMILDETHHTIVPIATILFWWFYEKSNLIKFKDLSRWILYPVLYLTWISIRGYISSFYPYYFVDANNLGTVKVIMNSLGLLVIIIMFLVIFYVIGEKIKTVANNV
ncbi:MULTISPECIES: Pr6Pr family membrane protein [Flavobacteriaceae]|uniref:Pr6Pr family membrane protein n=1 Tax=Flavobacteriaceae TaxID=49546 RepID=UPI001491B43B|nr:MULTISPECIES: Pr6Pr family membrane protein [Allomuricauda]MDC6367095.1 Pr6Pr family membrane protein [Muricauda sp. AC10]